MKTDFMLGASGWLRELSQKSQDEIVRRFPALPVDKISREAGYYLIVRDANNPTPGEARNKLERLRKKIGELRQEIDLGRLGPLDSLINQAIIDGPTNLTGELRRTAQYFEAAVIKAAKFIPKEGRILTPRNRLVRELAAIMRNAGMSVDVRPNSVLSQLTSIVLEDVGEEPSDARKIVKATLESSTAMAREVSTKT